ncbi:TPA: hypothetical protein DCG86_04740 [Candidatus Marinimicrobia bacterium]|nr:MAG: hypothetical protein XE04_0332 [Marinimicrobia bacterium 46_43]HAE87313.1 hypothetical protein [Candidatus Neomarinimicrobiota bacterium]HBY18394.1 hypothetical protein [Candidatus Neomarinimicrobiota bacterium]
MRHKVFVGVLFFLTLLMWNCENPFTPDIPESTYTNLPPETHISMIYHPDTILTAGDYWINDGDTIWVEENDSLILGLDTTVSVKEVFWWGDDPDGEVIGYYYQWSFMSEPEFTHEESDTFYLPLRSKFDIYSFKVWAVDNDSLEDSTPAVVSFPVYNSPPVLEWKLNSLPPVATTPNVVHQSFTHHSFFWDVYDLDGLETITAVYWALDDTSKWQRIDGNQRSIFLEDLEPGNHRIFFQAEDIAGAKSNVISFPDPDDDKIPNTWKVIEPVGDYLIVNDYASDQLNYTHQNFYKEIFDNIIGSDQYSIWEIGDNVNNAHNSIPYSTQDIEYNLSYFKNVFWFTFRGENSINQSALALTRFVADGGVLFMNNAMKGGTLADTTWSFTSIDTMYFFSKTGRVLPGTNIDAFWGDPVLDSTLALSLGSTLADRLWAIEPGKNAVIRYRFEDAGPNGQSYNGAPGIMTETRINEGICYYMTIPLYYCNGNENVDKLFKHVFELE